MFPEEAVFNMFFIVQKSTKKTQLNACLKTEHGEESWLGQNYQLHMSTSKLTDGLQYWIDYRQGK